MEQKEFDKVDLEKQKVYSMAICGLVVGSILMVLFVGGLLTVGQ